MTTLKVSLSHSPDESRCKSGSYRYAALFSFISPRYMWVKPRSSLDSMQPIPQNKNNGLDVWPDTLKNVRIRTYRPLVGVGPLLERDAEENFLS